MPFTKGQSGNATGRVRVVNANGGQYHRRHRQGRIGGRHCSADAVRSLLLPKQPRLIATPVADFEPAANAEAVQQQVNKLAALTVRGEFDVDALKTIADCLRISIDPRLAELEQAVRDLLERDRAAEHGP
jgi:hypothetical protein